MKTTMTSSRKEAPPWVNLKLTPATPGPGAAKQSAVLPAALVRRNLNNDDTTAAGAQQMAPFLLLEHLCTSLSSVWA